MDEGAGGDALEECNVTRACPCSGHIVLYSAIWYDQCMVVIIGGRQALRLSEILVAGFELRSSNMKVVTGV
jgi:hypothetical protein